MKPGNFIQFMNNYKILKVLFKSINIWRKLGHILRVGLTFLAIIQTYLVDFNEIVHATSRAHYLSIVHDKTWFWLLLFYFDYLEWFWRGSGSSAPKQKFVNWLDLFGQLLVLFWNRDFKIFSLWTFPLIAWTPLQKGGLNILDFVLKGGI